MSDLIDGLRETSRGQIMKAIDADMDRHRLRFAVDRLLDALRDWVRVYTRSEEDMAKLPDHDVVWVTESDEGPGKVILDAIKMHPELWAGAIPDQCCIVHRETLRKYVGADAAEYMASGGTVTVADQAARLRHENEECEMRKRYGKQP